MSLFDWLTRRKSRTQWIAEEEFIETGDEGSLIPENNNNMDLISSVNEMQHQDMVIQGRKEIDDFLNKDFESEGYSDALVNSDSSYSANNKEILKHQLELKVERVLTVYENKIRDYDFHIKTRQQNGMLDTVDEIDAEKKKIEEEISKIKTLMAETKENKGKGYIIILSYDRGFKRGLAAITASKLFGKTISNE